MSLFAALPPNTPLIHSGSNSTLHIDIWFVRDWAWPKKGGVITCVKCPEKKKQLADLAIPCILFKFAHITLYVFRRPFSDPSNQDVVKRLVQEVTSLDSTIPLLQIRGKYTCRTHFWCCMNMVTFLWKLRIPSTPLSCVLSTIDAARRFFQTKSDETSLKERGKYSTKVKQQRRRNRITRVRSCVIWTCVL